MKPIHILLISILIGFTACSDDLRVALQGDESNELPIDFTIMAPEGDFITRTIENPKTSFQNGDIIHIQGIFNTMVNGEETKVVRYGALIKVNNGWDTVPGNQLKWPNMAKTGSFTAYWINGSTGVLTTTEPLERNLSDIQSNTDPLMAQSSADIPYGNGVSLNFNHVCAYLTLEELEPYVSDTYWITSSGDPGAPVINNGFELKLNDDNTLSFQFKTIPDPTYTDASGNGMVYIAGKAVNEEISSGGHLENFTTANFFLEPGTYDNFMIKYPSTPPSSFEFLKYDFTLLPDNVGGEGEDNVVPILEAGKTYVLNVTKSPGITIVAPPNAESWDESDSFTKVTVPDFLEAINSGNEYSEGNVKILEQTSSGTRLLRNVDFDFAQYNGIFPTFDANINEGMEFDGDYHYIINIGSPVFRYNFGTIKNIGLKNINALLVTDESDDPLHDFSRMGILCQWNRTGSYIENVRIFSGDAPATITAMVKQDPGANPEDETHNIGIVVGSNTGIISDITLNGTFNLTETGYYSGEDGDTTPMQVDVTVLTGGITGQNAGTISNVSVFENTLVINIYNKCTGNYSALYTGGLIGQSTGWLSDVVLQGINVDCSGSSGQTLYSGCMVGEITSTSDSSFQSGLDNCFVNGSVKAGTPIPNDGAISSVAYTGGISGALQNPPVLNSRIGASVAGPSLSNDNVVYATGGCFGRIRTASEINNIIAYGASLTGVDYIGNFAGIVPAGMDWSDYSSNNISVREFPSYNNIGISQ